MATAKNPKRNLTEKQLAFIDEYLECFSAVKAYIKAGYSANGKKATINKNAYTLLNSEAVQNEIKERMESMRDGTDLLKMKLEKFFVEQIENTEIAPKDRLKSAELLARLINAFDNKVTLDSNDLQFNFNILSAEKDEEDE